jgi:hypothetical protein
LVGDPITKRVGGSTRQPVYNLVNQPTRLA